MEKHSLLVSVCRCNRVSKKPIFAKSICGRFHGFGRAQDSKTAIAKANSECSERMLLETSNPRLQEIFSRAPRAKNYQFLGFQVRTIGTALSRSMHVSGDRAAIEYIERRTLANRSLLISENAEFGVPLLTEDDQFAMRSYVTKVGALFFGCVWNENSRLWGAGVHEKNESALKLATEEYLMNRTIKDSSNSLVLNSLELKAPLTVEFVRQGPVALPGCCGTAKSSLFYCSALDNYLSVVTTF